MKIIENLKKKTENTHTKEELKEHTGDVVKKAGMTLDDNDLERISGGGYFDSFYENDRKERYGK